MFLNHIAVFCSSEEESDTFYGNLLGLKKVNSRVLPSGLIEKIFGVSIELKMVNYANDDIRFEVFIGDDKGLDVHKIGHACLEVDDREAFIKECEAMNLKINKIPRDDSFILFISDYEGNLFEIKEKKMVADSR
ncbi:MAG: VOC family protein [Deltaproteobacteria bacterium]|nr:VOC family protein [Deltaproteobacteria bacterium]MBW1848000.1 VOC family protein [Deltaproteobacteria bacterium]MBW2178887.1 VOC family protein [Deltaproteobacteria bacterium]